MVRTHVMLRITTMAAGNQQHVRNRMQQLRPLTPATTPIWKQLREDTTLHVVIAITNVKYLRVRSLRRCLSLAASRRWRHSRCCVSKHRRSQGNAGRVHESSCIVNEVTGTVGAQVPLEAIL